MTRSTQVSPELGLDWAQEFSGRGATFIGNTGFAYGDQDLLAYSELLMLNFVKYLGYKPGADQPTVGQALRQAKLAYYSSLAAGTLSMYDQKLLGEMTLYGLPMQAVKWNQTGTDPITGADPAFAVATPSVFPAATLGPITNRLRRRQQISSLSRLRLFAELQLHRQQWQQGHVLLDSRRGRPAAHRWPSGPATHSNQSRLQREDSPRGLDDRWRIH